MLRSYNPNARYKYHQVKNHTIITVFIKGTTFKISLTTKSFIHLHQPIVPTLIKLHSTRHQIIEGIAKPSFNLQVVFRLHVPILFKDVSLNYGISCFILFVCVHIHIKKIRRKGKKIEVLYGLRGIWFD